MDVDIYDGSETHMQFSEQIIKRGTHIGNLQTIESLFGCLSFSFLNIFYFLVTHSGYNTSLRIEV